MFSFFENLKKRLFEEWKNFESRLLESNHFNLLKEKYQSLSLLQQKLIKYGFLCFICFVLAYLPLSYFFSSSVYWMKFKEKQELSLELLKMRNKISSSGFRLSKNQLNRKIENIIEKYSEKAFEIKEKKRKMSKDSIYEIGFDVHLKHLNIKQAVQLGTELNNLSQSRLESIVIKENQTYPKHYDVDYKLSSFVSKEENRVKKRPRARIKPSDQSKKSKKKVRESPSRKRETRRKVKEKPLKGENPSFKEKILLEKESVL